jgi:hypothetical protein
MGRGGSTASNQENGNLNTYIENANWRYCKRVPRKNIKQTIWW